MTRLATIVTVLLVIDTVLSEQLGQSCRSDEHCNVNDSICLEEVCKCNSYSVDDNGATTGGSCRNKKDFTPKNIQVADTGATTIRVVWTDPLAIDLISHFVVTTKEVVTHVRSVQNVSKTYTIITTDCTQSQRMFVAVINNLSATSNYKILIESVTIFNEKIGAVIYQYTKPSKPVITNFTDIAPNIQISWTGDNITSEKYIVEVRKRNVLHSNTTVSGKSMTIANLQSGAMYEIKIFGYSRRSGLVGDPRVKNINTRPKPPGPPRKLSYDLRSKSQLILHWLEPDNPNGMVDYYWIHVELDNELTGSVIQTTDQANSWAFTRIDTTKDYCFSVYSHNSGGYNSTYPAYICLSEKSKQGCTVGQTSHIVAIVILTLYGFVSTLILVIIYIYRKRVIRNKRKYHQSADDRESRSFTR